MSQTINTSIKGLHLLVLIFITLNGCIITSENFTQPKPEVLPPTEIGPYSFKANWSRVISAKSYQLEVIAQKDGKPIPLDTALITTNYFRVVNLEVDQRYSYRVRANLGNGQFSEPSEWMDVITRIPNLQAPKALPPTNRTALEFITQWEPIAGIRKYILQVATDPGMNDILLDTTISTTSMSVYQSNFDIPYYYHVAALDDATQEISLYSEVIEVPRGVSPQCRLTYLSLLNGQLASTVQIFRYDQYNRLTAIENSPDTTDSEGNIIGFGGHFLGFEHPPINGQPPYPDFTSGVFRFPFNPNTTLYPNDNISTEINFTWTIQYIGTSNLIKEAELYSYNRGRVLQRRRFSYSLDPGTQQITEAKVELLDRNYSNQAGSPTWVFNFDQQGRIIRWREYTPQGNIPLHPIYGTMDVKYTYDKNGKMIEARGTDGNNATVYGYDNYFNPIALLRNPLLAQFVYVPRLNVIGPEISTYSNVGVNMFLPLNNLTRQQTKVTLANYFGNVLRSGARIDNNPTSKTRTFALLTEGDIAYEEIRFEGCK